MVVFPAKRPSMCGGSGYPLVEPVLAVYSGCNPGKNASLITEEMMSYRSRSHGKQNVAIGKLPD
jgi:hypothetical protein